MTAKRQYGRSGASHGHYNRTNNISIETAVSLHINKLREVINHETKQI